MGYGFQFFINQSKQLSIDQRIIQVYRIWLVKIGNNDNFITIDIDDVQLDATLSITRYD